MPRMTRRKALQGLGVAGAAMLLRVDTDAQGQPLTIAGQPVELRIASISPVTVRVSILPKGAPDADLNRDGGLVPLTEERRTISGAGPVKIGRLLVTVSSPSTGGYGGLPPSPLRVRVADATGTTVQELTVDEAGVLEFLNGDAPLLGFGEGGPQFDRRGAVDAMRNGQGGYQLRTHGARVPVQWLIGTAGWGLFIHQPFGAFNLQGPRGKMT